MLHELAFDALSLDEIDFNFDQGLRINLKDIIVEKLVFSKKASLDEGIAKQFITAIERLSSASDVEINAEEIVKLPAVAKLDALTLAGIKIDPNLIEVGQVIFDNLTSHVTIKQDKTIANLIELGGQNDQALNQAAQFHPID